MWSKNQRITIIFITCIIALILSAASKSAAKVEELEARLLEEAALAAVEEQFPGRTPEESAEIWAWAHQLVEEWYERYKVIKAEKEADDKAIASYKYIKKEQSEYSRIIYSSTHKQYTKIGDPSKAKPTRTLSMLTGWAESNWSKFTYEEDEWGGFKIASMKQKATGYFYVKKINGRWWYIDPLGYPYFCMGTTAMGYAYGNLNQEKAALNRYGTLAERAIAAVREYKDELGFNSTTIWSEGHSHLRDVYDTVTYSASLRIVSTYESKLGAKDPTPSGSCLVLYGMHVFDPDFPAHCDSRVKADCYPNRLADPYFMGFYLDNEIPTNEDMLDEFLTLDIKELKINYYSYAAAWTFLAHETGKPNPTLEDAKNYELRDLFRGFVYDRLYAAAVPAIRKYAPSALVMGNRALSTQRNSEWMTRMVGYHSDVISHNWYHQVTPLAEQLNQMSLWCDKPMMVTEWFVSSDENEGNFQNGTTNIVPIVQTQVDRGAQYQNYTLRMLECQNMVGWHWYRYIDRNDITEDGKQSNQGIYSSNHNLYEEFAEYVAEINRNAYALALYFDQR